MVDSLVRSNLEFYDIVRLDHFAADLTGLPAEETTARNGRWITCPGLDYLKRRKACLKPNWWPKISAITEVNKLRTITGLPGMAVLPFAFSHGADNAYLPHNLEANCVAYSGTRQRYSVGWYR